MEYLHDRNTFNSWILRNYFSRNSCLNAVRFCVNLSRFLGSKFLLTSAISLSKHCERRCCWSTGCKKKRGCVSSSGNHPFLISKSNKCQTLQLLSHDSLCPKMEPANGAAVHSFYFFYRNITKYNFHDESTLSQCYCTAVQFLLQDQKMKISPWHYDLLPDVKLCWHDILRACA